MAPSSRRAAGAGPRSGKSGKRAPGRRAGRGTSGGARGPRVQLKNGLARTKAKADLGAGDATPLYPGFIPGGSDDLRWATRKKPGSRGCWLEGRQLDGVAEVGEAADEPSGLHLL